MIVVLNLFDVIPGKHAQYAEYLRRVQPLLDKYGAKVLLYGLTRAVYMGDCSQEFCGMIAYENLDALRALSHDPEFNRIRALRDGSTRNYVLTAIEDFPSLNDAVTHLERIAASEPQSETQPERDS